MPPATWRTLAEHPDRAEGEDRLAPEVAHAQVPARYASEQQFRSFVGSMVEAMRGAEWRLLR